jgi:hypothetical protein
MKTFENFESVQLMNTEMELVKGGDRSLKFTHWHQIDVPAGADYTLMQRCTWWGFYETSSNPVRD